jgi:CHAT domain-containing protein
MKVLPPRPWSMLGSPAEHLLVKEGVRRGANVVFLTNGILAELPLWLARDPLSGELLGERYVVTISPSLEALTPRPSTLPATTPVATLFNQDAEPALEMTEVAKELFRSVARNTKYVSPVRSETSDSIIPQFKGARVWYLWTHGYFDQENVTRSGVQVGVRLSDHHSLNLTVADLLRAQLGDEGPDLVVLSACETGLADVGNNDEMVGPPVALMRAGSRAVISSMWSVSEDATALLMTRFHELRSSTTLTASRALWNAGRWLKNSSALELRNYLDVHVDEPPGTSPAQALERLRSKLESYDDSEKPYSDPYYWAAFVLSGADTSAGGPTELPIHKSDR